MASVGAPGSSAAAAPHAPHAGRCTTWVDDELEARGLADVVEERPGCCEKDAAQAAQAARVHAVLSAADPSRRAVALRAGALAQPPPSSAPRRVDDDAGDSDESSDFGDDDAAAAAQAGGDDDAALAELRAARLRQLQREAAARSAAAAGDYSQVSELQLPALTAAHARLVAHFPLAGVDACARVDEHLAALARAQPGTRFVRVAAPAQGHSPVLAAAAVGAPPALLLFRRGRLAAAAPGLALFGGAEDLQEGRITRWLQAAGALRGAADAGADNSDEDAEGDAAAALGTRASAMPPCPSCGRTYPHEHIRALRTGGGADSDADDS